LDLVRARADPGDVEQLLLNTATQDGKRVKIALSGFTVRPTTRAATS